MDRRTKKWIWAAFWFYCAAMAWLLFGQRLGAPRPADYRAAMAANMNLVPLWTIRHFLALTQGAAGPYLARFAAVNLLGNVWVFVPLGVFMPALWRPMEKLWLFALCLAGLIVAIELVQLVTLLGSCDVDDLILNMTGGLLGYGGWRLARRRRR